MTGSDPDPRFAAVVAAEIVGTLIVTTVVVGTSVIGAVVLGPLGIATATGFALLAVVATVGRVSGGHVNPAVTIGLALAGRFPWRDVSTYVIAQLVGATLGAAVVLTIVADGPPGALQEAQRVGFAAGGFGVGGSPDGYGLLAVALVETLLTAALVGAYLVADGRHGDGARDRSPAAALVGATLVAITLLALPVSNASFNPARSLATALFAGPDRLAQVWVFIVFPLLGAALAALATRWARRVPRRRMTESD
ncbi:aquaporin Z [Labedella populi]|uniref:Aquaporin Z n=1 Tax=Labedella populi TaxID=2498850 RepID=A0A3S4ED20_9MICO|nr:aquaporin [Labedella populi]RWZ68548.1 aquaporin Z [Labedella populi]